MNSQTCEADNLPKRPRRANTAITPKNTSMHPSLHFMHATFAIQDMSWFAYASGLATSWLIAAHDIIHANLFAADDLLLFGCADRFFDIISHGQFLLISGRSRDNEINSGYREQITRSSKIAIWEW